MNNEPDYDNLYFEEKKMHKPEVGDVWQTVNQRIVILCIDNDVCGCAVDNSSNFIQWRHKDSFKKYTYLGKSKASIEQLFEVENEECYSD